MTFSPPPGFLTDGKGRNGKDVGLAGLVFHDVQFTEVKTHERDMQFAFRERGAVIFDVDFRNVNEERAAKARRV